jgi:hypothetical protein
MNLSNIFGDLDIRAKLIAFSDSEKDAVEQVLFEKAGKTYIKCQVRNKDVLAKQEEIIRQAYYFFKNGTTTVKLDHCVLARKQQFQNKLDLRLHENFELCI